MIDNAAENDIHESVENVSESKEFQLPWWASVPREVLFPPPPAPPMPLAGRRDRAVSRRATVRRRQGPGRPSVMTDEMIKEARQMHESGEYSAADIAWELGVSRSTVFRHLRN